MNSFDSTLVMLLVMLLVPGLPLLLAIGLMSGCLRRLVFALAPWAALPALVMSVLMTPGISVELPWLLLGSFFGFDETARIFLFFTSLLWLAAGIYSTAYFSERLLNLEKSGFFIWFLLAMAGNLGLILAQDMVTFYSFFALMSFASYGMVVFDGTAQALRAGRVTIILVVVGEVLLFAAFIMAAQAAGSIEFQPVQSAVADSASRNWIIGLVLLGFGIKAGVIGLHVWLPLAHPVAPPPASAVLSGAMIAAGLLGWLRVLPLGETALPVWGGIMMAAGMVAVFYAVLIGVLQSNAKVVLAYSSISIMGIMTTVVGLGLIAPDRWPLLLTAVLIFALHHGIAKGALFLGVGFVAVQLASKVQRYLLLAGLLLPALALAGAPWTSGMMAKHFLKLSATSTSLPWSDALLILWSLSSVATSILMLRFLYLVWQQGKKIACSPAKSAASVMWLSWSVLLLVVLFNPWFISIDSDTNPWSEQTVISALWPLVLGVGVAFSAFWFARQSFIRNLWFPRQFRIPAGDILLIVEKPLHCFMASFYAFSFNILPGWQLSLMAAWNRLQYRSGLRLMIGAGENQLQRWMVAITLVLILLMVFVFLLAY